MQLANRAELETRFGRMLRGMSAARRAELLRIVGDPPDVSRVPESYWREYEDELAALLLLLLMMASTRSAAQHGLDESQARSAADAWATAESRTLAMDWIVRTRARIGDALAGPRAPDMFDRDGFAEMLDGPFGDARADGLVTTETTRAAVWGGELAVRRAGGINAGDVWKLNPGKSSTGPCPICKPLGGTTRATWGLQFPEGPPAHPNCVCEILYVALGQASPVP